MSGAGHVDASNKKVALLIAVLALALAVSETLGKGAQTSAIALNIEASNLWAFFQAKTIRMTTVLTAADQAEIELAQTSGAQKEALEKRIDTWRRTAARYDTEPETNEGRRELAARAKVAEAKRDVAFAAYHYYELASAAVQIAIVLASAEIITGVAFLSWVAAALGLIGVAMGVIGFFWPTAVHLF
jgi:hypothetical protein